MDFGNYQKELFKRKPEPGIHSYAHSVVKDVCDYFGKMKEFGLWLGIAKRIGIGELSAKLKYCQERGIRNPKYLLAMCRKK